MKKSTKCTFLAMACMMSFSAFGGCGGGGGNSSAGGTFDYSKTQIWIYNHENAIGSVWLDSLKARFEAEYADKEFSNGTKGIEVHVFGQRSALDTVTLATQPYQIVFTEGSGPADLYDSNSFYDMTDWVKETTAEGKSIESKLSDEMKASYTMRGGYYTLPHFESYANPTYNRHLFEEKGLYFADDVNELYSGTTAPDKSNPSYGILLKNKTAKKSCGPDGIYNTDDDGLPSSVEELKQLVDCMVSLSITPFVAYASTYHYTNKMLYSMWATLEGYDGAMLYVSGDGNQYGSTQIVALDENGKVKKNSDGSVQLETYTLDGLNSRDGYKIERQASKYYALDFYQHIFNKSNIDTYYDTDGLSSTTSHTDVQRRFLESEVSSKSKVAFLMDGSYWENESKDAGNLKKLQQSNPDYYAEMEYRLFSLPTQYTGRVEAVGEADKDGNVTYYAGKSEADSKKQVMVSNLNCNTYVNRFALLGVDGKIDSSVEEATKLFIQYMYSDESLSEATGITGMFRPLQYEISATDKAKLSSFSKSVLEMRETSEVLVPFASTNYFKYNSSIFGLSPNENDDMFTSNDGKDTVRYAINGFRYNNMTLDTYFEGIAINRGESWWNSLVR